MSVQVTKTDTAIQVKSSYNEAFIKIAKQIGGRWNGANKSWDFAVENEELVMKNLAEIYSYSNENETMVYLYIDVDKWIGNEYTDALWLRNWRYLRGEWKMTGYKELLKHDEKFRYMLLSRLQSDCNYYLGNGNRNKKHLWAGSEQGQIEAMKELWNSFTNDEKPRWLSWDDILNYEAEMVGF